MTRDLIHSLDALVGAGINVQKAFGPQHGMRGDKQDNMIESGDYVDPLHQIPVVSLYGIHRKPTEDMLADLDVVLFDLQDVGCRIYTYITTLKYFLEVCGEVGTELWVLDRPNPAGRQIDGLCLEPGQESFVGADTMPTRHGLTVGELAHWFVDTNEYDVSYKIVSMTGYDPLKPWPESISWVNPSPNAASLNMTRCFPGTVLLEGTTLSEGRGTTVPLEVIGAPDLPVTDMLAMLNQEALPWTKGAVLRPCFFEPTFHKHVHEMCHGIQIHTDNDQYQPNEFYPYRLIAGLLKTLRQLRSDYDIWRHHEYEYELDRIPIDVINGGDKLRLWVDDDSADFEQLEAQLVRDAQDWTTSRVRHLIY
jgi:uncharacterized protein YbbC (DUF1343 family)